MQHLIYYNDDLQRQALKDHEQARQIHALRQLQPRDLWQRVVLRWAGGRMLKSGRYLLALADETIQPQPVSQRA